MSMTCAGDDLRVSTAAVALRPAAGDAEVATELAEAAAVAIAAFIPWRATNVPNGGLNDHWDGNRHLAHRAKYLFKRGGSGI
jgi:hypothetical protein